MAQIIEWNNSCGFTIKVTPWELTNLYHAVWQALKKTEKKITGHSLADAHFDIEIIKRET